MTVEDPIEFLHRHKKSLVNQREVGADTHSFANALKHVLRQDPDIILVGEMRDLETISVALTAAETGHLVFATLHTQDAAQTIDRVIDVFPAHQQAPGPHAARRRHPGRRLPDAAPSAPTPRAAPSRPRCSSPRRPSATSSVRARRTRSTRRCRPAPQQGMHTMDQHLADLVKTGKISLRDRPREVPPRRGLQPADRPVHGGSAGRRADQGRHGRRLLRRRRSDGHRAARRSSTRSATRAGKIVKGRIEAPEPGGGRQPAARRWAWRPCRSPRSAPAACKGDHHPRLRRTRSRSRTSRSCRASWRR